MQSNLNSIEYQSILDNHVIPFVNPNGQIFQQDNASCHSSSSTKAWLECQNIPLLEWPPRSPDLNPIEHVWDAMGRRLQGKHPRNLDELWVYLRTIWNEVSGQFLRDLIDSMPRRIQSVLAAKGGQTLY